MLLIGSKILPIPPELGFLLTTHSFRARHAVRIGVRHDYLFRKDVRL